jgi:2-phosphosulfolactate phosphatase
MRGERDILVHLSPALVARERLAGAAAVVIDVLRATTTIVHALAAGCVAVRPCADAQAAVAAARELPAGAVLLGGERDARPMPGFDLGNSPGGYTPDVCRGKTLLLSTTNGTRTLLLAAAADRVVAAGFVNAAAVCELLRHETRPLHILCAGDQGRVALEDVLVAGDLVRRLVAFGPARLDDGARIARYCYAAHAADLFDALAQSGGGRRLTALGYEADVRAAAQVDAFAIVPELRRDPTRLEILHSATGR